MGYFANGTAGDHFEAQWCARCVHGLDEEKGCPVMLAHILWAYELCNEKKHPGKIMLDMLIPDGERSCAMFVPASRLLSKERVKQEERLAYLKAGGKW